jgi:hypothetical protein
MSTILVDFATDPIPLPLSVALETGVALKKQAAMEARTLPFEAAISFQSFAAPPAAGDAEVSPAGHRQ